MSSAYVQTVECIISSIGCCPTVLNITLLDMKLDSLKRMWYSERGCHLCHKLISSYDSHSTATLHQSLANASFCTLNYFSDVSWSFDGVISVYQISLLRGSFFDGVISVYQISLLKGSFSSIIVQIWWTVCGLYMWGYTVQFKVIII